MRESTVERHLVQRVRSLGGMCLKLMPMPAGTPDRIVVLPGNRVYFVETKQPKGEVSPIQLERHRRLGLIGYPVAVLWNKKEVDQWMTQFE
jgi:hypothetical protein